MLHFRSNSQRPIPNAQTPQHWRVEIVSGTLKSIVVAGMLSAVTVASCARGPEAPPGNSEGIAVITKAGAVERMLERTAPHVPDTAVAPSFVVDPGWPKPLPNNWRLGQIGGLFVDRKDTIWVYHRPRSLSSTEAGALDAAGKDAKGNPVSALGHPRAYGQHSACCIPAPSVLRFDRAGNLLGAWGGPSDPGFLEKKCRREDGCDWPAREHGIYVDHNDFVYISGNGEDFTGQFPWAAKFGDDSHVLKFTADGTFVLQIGYAGSKRPNSDDTHGGPNATPQPYLPADMTVDPKTNYLYIADGYGNRRVLIVDAATGKYIGHFGAYGQNPVDAENTVIGDAGYEVGLWAAEFDKGQMKPKIFRSPLHCAKLSNDGLLYACDRNNNRIQVFKAAEVGKPCSNPDGEVGKCGFVGEVHVAPQSAGGTAGSVNFSPDPAQSCMYVADLSNNTIYTLNRENLQELDRLGRAGRQLGEFHWVHVVSVDSEGNLYTGEVDNANRVQKFLRYGPTSCSGTGASEVGRYH
jgi:DNA-binding beta-propeller fold protein YncE